MPVGLSVSSRKLMMIMILSSLSQKVPLSLRERVGVRASERRNRLRKPAAIRTILTSEPCPAEHVRGDYGIVSSSPVNDFLGKF